MTANGWAQLKEVLEPLNFEEREVIWNMLRDDICQHLSTSSKFSNWPHLLMLISDGGIRRTLEVWHTRQPLTKVEPVPNG